jgi:Flp pilus assembly protein CpaB
MQRGRFLILVGILLAVTAAGLLLLMNRNGESKSQDTQDQGEVTVAPTPVPPTPIPTDRVVVAQQRIDRGTLLVTDTQVALNEWVSLENWPKGWVTQDALVSLDQVVGRVARSDIPRGTLLTADMLTDQAGDLGATGSDAALLIPPDRVAVAVPVDHISSVGWSLRRGDRVDVLVSFLMIDLDEEFQTALPNQASTLVNIEQGGVAAEGTTILQGVYGRIEQDPFGQPINVIPSEARQRPRLISQVTVRDAEVLNVGPWGELFSTPGAINYTSTSSASSATDQSSQVDGGDGSDSSGQVASTPQQVEILMEEGRDLTEDEALSVYLNAEQKQPLLLVVTPQDALVLKWADEAGAAIHLALRSQADRGIPLPDTEPVTMQYMVDRFGIALPPGVPYGVDPAVLDLKRSFLQLPDLLWPKQTTQSTSNEPPR